MPDSITGRTDPLVYWHDRILAGVACLLCVSSQVKFAQIQLLELIYAGDLLLVMLYLLARPSPIRIFGPYFRIGIRWGYFSLASIGLAVLALQRDFFIGPEASFLKGPLMVTLSRVAELALDLFAMIYLASRCKVDKSLCRYTLWCYCAAGLAGCVYGWLSEVFLVAGFKLGGVAIDYRMNGFNNEGGPFGVHLVSVVMGLIALRQEKWIKHSSFLLALFLVTASLIASKSKSALLEIIVFVSLIAFLKMRVTRAVALASAVFVVGFVLFQVTGLSRLVVDYVALVDKYRQLSLVRSTDYNIVAGRISGTYLAPKMIAAHPLAGIGLGNYPIVRDAPQYRRGSAIVAIPLDSPSLGPIDYIVELGFPLFLYLTYIQIAPAVSVLRKGANAGIVAMLLVLPISVWFGAHLNFTFMWISAAIGLGVFYQDERFHGGTGGSSTASPGTDLGRAEHVTV